MWFHDLSKREERASLSIYFLSENIVSAERAIRADVTPGRPAFTIAFSLELRRSERSVKYVKLMDTGDRKCYTSRLIDRELLFSLFYR